MFALIESYFLHYRIDHSIEHEIVRFIDQNIDKPIDWLVHKSGYSQKHVIHLLKKHTGFSPKYLQRLHRFHSVVKRFKTIKIRSIGFQLFIVMVISDSGTFDQRFLIFLRHQSH